jgi:hypothetical protein
MEIKIEIPNYSDSNGIKYKWENGFEIEVKIINGVINIVANKAGLQSLANHLLNLAQDEVPISHHLHFDVNNSLENGSSDLIIEKR